MLCYLSLRLCADLSERLLQDQHLNGLTRTGCPCRHCEVRRGRQLVFSFLSTLANYGELSCCNTKRSVWVCVLRT